MDGLPLPRGSESQKIHERFCVIVEECIENNMTMAETLRYVQNKYLIPHEHTNRVWNHLERTNPDLFISYNARIRQRNAQPEILQRILDTLDQIQSNTEQIVKLLSGVHGFGPHPSAVSSLKRDKGNSEEAEKQQKNEKGDHNEETEKWKDQNIQLPQ